MCQICDYISGKRQVLAYIAYYTICSAFQVGYHIVNLALKLCNLAKYLYVCLGPRAAGRNALTKMAEMLYDLCLELCNVI